MLCDQGNAEGTYNGGGEYSAELSEENSDLRKKLGRAGLTADDLVNNNTFEGKEFNEKRTTNVERPTTTTLRNGYCQTSQSREQHGMNTFERPSTTCQTPSSSECGAVIYEKGASYTSSVGNDPSDTIGVNPARLLSVVEESRSSLRFSSRANFDKKTFVAWESEMSPLDEKQSAETVRGDEIISSERSSFSKKTRTDWKIDKELIPVETLSIKKYADSSMTALTLEKMSNAESTKKKTSILDSQGINDTAKSILAFEMDPETIFAQLPAVGPRPFSSAEDVLERTTDSSSDNRDEERTKACRALWKERYSLSKRDDISSSSVSGDLSDGEALSLSDGEEQVFQSNPSSQESDNEEYDDANGGKMKKTFKHLSSITLKGTVDEEVKDTEDEGDDCEGHFGDNVSLAPSTSCSEDSFEIGTIVVSTPRIIPRRSVDDYVVRSRNSLSLSSLKSGLMDAGQLSRDCIEEEKEASPSPSTELVRRPGDNREIEDKVKNDNNTFQTPLAWVNVKNAAACGNASERIPLRDPTSPANLESSLERGSAVYTDISPNCLSSVGLCSSTSQTSSSTRQRKIINEELSALDTGLPQLDFEKLEKQLKDAAEERELNQRKLMSEHVLRRLTTDAGDQPRYHPPPATKRPLRSNLGTRLQSGMSLQICFMNDVIPTDDDEDEGEWADDDDDDCGCGKVPKSRSTPNLGVPSGSAKGVGRSVSSCGDSTKRASELRRSMLERHKSEDQDFTKRQARLEEEAKLMLSKAKDAARMQMEMERQEKAKDSIIEKLIGVPSLGRRKLTRQQLTKMGITQLQIILNDLHSKVEALNDELVRLLMERDSLHMEQDSMLVDIEDLLQHRRCVDLPLPDFLVADAVIVAPTNNGNNNNKHTRFRIFKR